MSISAVILTKNEAKNIERAIKSVKFCAEIVVVDDFSSDDTVKKARELGANIFQRRLKDDFAAQRNFAMEKVKGEWVLFVDADEEVTRELKDEIAFLRRDVINHVSTIGKDYSAYYIKRRDFWWGRELRYGEIKKIRQMGLIRLVKKNSGYWEGKAHEEFKVKSDPFDKTQGHPERSRTDEKLKVKSLKNYLNHYPHPRVKNFLKEINFYSTLRAKELFDQGENTNILEIILYPLGKFLLTYFIKLGFLDGPGGFAYAFFMSFHSFLVRAKLYQYTRINTDKNTKKY